MTAATPAAVQAAQGRPAARFPQGQAVDLPSTKDLRHVPEGGKPTLLGQKGSERPAYDFDGMLCEDGPATGEGTEMSEFSYSFAVNLRFEGTMQGVSGKTLLGQLLQNTQDPGKAIAADRNPYSNSVMSRKRSTLLQGR